MKKLLVFAVLLLSGCVSVADLTKYPHYDVAEPAEKAKVYIPSGEIAQSTPVQRVMKQYFLSASSRQDADFIVKSEEFQPDMSGFGSFFLSGMTLWILPTWSTHELSIPFSLTDVSAGKTIPLSNVRIKEREYYGWLLLPLAFASDTYYMGSDAFSSAYASAMEEAASLIYDSNSRLYRTEKKERGRDRPVGERNTESPQGKQPSPAVPAGTTPEKPADTDILW